MHWVIAFVALITGTAFQVLLSTSDAHVEQSILAGFAFFVIACIVATKNMRHPYKLLTQRSASRNFDAYITSTFLIFLIADSVFADGTPIANPVPAITLGFMYVGIRHLMKGFYPELYKPA